MLVSFGVVGCGGDEPTADAAPRADEPTDVVVADADGSEAPPSTTQRVFEVRDVSFTIPEPWMPEAPSNAMRAAQFRIDPPQGVGVEPAVGAVFTSIGGSIEDNVARWENQFVNEGEREVARSIETVNGRMVATFMGRGTFDEGRMLGSTGPKPDYMTLGFLVELNADKPLIVKITGPAAALEPALRTWERMVGSLTIDGAPAVAGEAAGMDGEQGN